MVGPHGHGQGGDGDGRVDQTLVAEDWLAAEDGEDLRDDAEERQRDDVDLGVPEEPEQVLPEDSPAVLRVIDVGAEFAVRPQGKQGRSQRREGHDHQDGRDQCVPGENGHPPHGHARGTHADDGGDEVDRAQDGAEAGQRQAEDPQVTTDARGECCVVQWRVGEPAERRSTLRGDEARDGDGGSEEEEPEGQRVQPREGDIGGTDLQRHDDVAETGEQRGGEHQQHHGAVHREQLVVLFLGLQDLHAGFEQFSTDQQRHDATEAEEHKRRDQVHVPDDLVVGGGDPGDHHGAFAPRHYCRGRGFGGP